MPIEIGLWRVDSGTPRRLTARGVPLERQLEDYIEADPSLLGEPIMLIGRQVPTGYGYIDLLGIDADGALYVLELKRERTPRDVVAQVLDYGSWAAALSHDQVLEIYEDYGSESAFEEAFVEHLGGDPPAEVNASQVLTIVASDVDPATERITRYLNERYDVPVNVVFFRYFEDAGRSYVARTWLVDDEREPVSRKRSGKETWNGRDWYVSFGDRDTAGRNWEDARTYGFVSAGGRPWFSRTLRRLPIGARIFAYLPQAGYAGVGTVVGEAQPFDEAVVQHEGEDERLADLTLVGSYHHAPDGDTPETAEYIVPVRWQATKPRDAAIRRPGLFANQNSACPLRNKFTLDVLAHEFGLDDELPKDPPTGPPTPSK